MVVAAQNWRRLNRLPDDCESRRIFMVHSSLPDFSSSAFRESSEEGRPPQFAFPQGLKPRIHFAAFAARLKPCPFKASTYSEAPHSFRGPSSLQRPLIASGATYSF